MKRTLLVTLSLALVLAGCAPADEKAPLGAASESPTPSPSGSVTVSPSPTPTEEPQSENLRVAVFGDTGSGLPAQQQVADRMCRWRAKHPFDHVFTTGDNIYPDGDPALFEERFFKPYDCLHSEGVRWHAALGNHDIVIDGGRPEIEEPSFGIEARNYVVRLDGVRFVIADSNDLRMRFLRRKTRRSPDVRATIVLFHHPVMSAGDSHGPTPGFAEKLLGLFARRGVDLVLNGHDHVYSRSKPVGGVRYLVTGGGGALLNGCRAAIGIVRCESRYHFLYLVIGEDSVRVKAVPASGRPFDRLEIPFNP